jgi:CheY-like chemotaxis protein
MNILVVEVEPDILEFVAAHLIKAGHQVVTALRAEEALRVYHEHERFDFVLCDLTLDGKTTGLQLMHLIHERNKDQDYGFMTGHPILKKPLSEKSLLDLVEKHDPFTAIADVDRMMVFNDDYGHKPGDVLLRRLAEILAGLGLNAHQKGNSFMCKGESPQELEPKLLQAQQMFRLAFEVFADGRIQTIEGMSFCFGVGTTLEKAEAAMLQQKRLPRF